MSSSEKVRIYAKIWILFTFCESLFEKKFIERRNNKVRVTAVNEHTILNFYTGHGPSKMLWMDCIFGFLKIAPTLAISKLDFLIHSVGFQQPTSNLFLIELLPACSSIKICCLKYRIWDQLNTAELNLITNLTWTFNVYKTIKYVEHPISRE